MKVSDMPKVTLLVCGRPRTNKLSESLSHAISTRLNCFCLFNHLFKHWVIIEINMPVLEEVQ